ncbi:TetR/AcrR family transcriptional regulator [Herbaspirillum lusitanum]|uniref:TetR/AcrR family transcriptional regulator n=1 Tax=Herbaspirillum lusitanum TaxID=213312 RepID=A0ABW9AC39_9BURK
MAIAARTSDLDEADGVKVELVIEEGVRFDVLLDEKSRDRNFGKRDRTRFQVMACVARQLLDEPAKNPSIEAVLDETGLSRGTFYNNFTDMDGAIETVLSAFFEALWAHRPKADTAKSTQENYDPLYDANLWYCQSYETNAGLFAAFTRVAAYTPTLLRMREEMNASWVERVISATVKKRGHAFSAAERKAFQGALRLMVAMSIEALRERYIHLDALLSNSFPDATAMAVGLTEIWQETIQRHIKS